MKLTRTSLLTLLALLSLGLASCRRISWELVKHPVPERCCSDDQQGSTPTEVPQSSPCEPAISR